MKRVLTFAIPVALVLALGLAATADAQSSRKRAENPTEADRVGRDGAPTRRLPSPVFAGGARSLAPGTIQYDDGTANALPTASSFCYGNQFNTAVGNPLTASGTITNLSFFVTGTGTDNVFVSAFDQLAGTAANFLGSFSVPANAGGFNTAALNIPYVGNTFLAGVWYIGGDTVALGTGTTAGQGIHGMLINDIVATGFSALSVNTLIRARGNVVIPVELTAFEVLDN